MSRSASHFYEFGEFRLYPEERILLRGEESVSLPPKVFEVLVALVENSGRVIEKDELIKRIWPDTFVEEATLAQYIFSLRRVLNAGQGERQFIETVPKRGYRFVLKAQEGWDETGTSELKRSRAATVIKEEAGERDTPITSLAVLPFANVGNSPQAEYLSDGITEQIINSLSRLPQLRVMARSVVFRYKDKEIDPQKVGREIGVQAVVVGRLLQLDNRLIVRVEMVDVANGWQLWGEQYNREISDILLLEEEIARNISENLRLRLTGEEPKLMDETRPHNIEAYQLYLKGHYHINRHTIEDCQQAIRFFEQAVEKDGSYALAYCGIADAYVLLDFYGLHPPWEVIPKAKAAALKALEISETLAEAHTSLGCVKLIYERDWTGAESEFKRAIELNPAYAPVHSWYSLYLLAMGLTEEAFAESKLALELEPLDVSINQHLGWYYLYTRQYDEAIQQLKKTLEIDQNFFLARILLGRAYEQKGDYSAAITEYQRASLLEHPPIILGLLGHAYALSGDKEKALSFLGELKDISNRRYVPPYSLGLIYTGLNDQEQAVDSFEQACQARNEWFIWARINPDLDGLRQHPRFKELLRCLDQEA